MKRWSRFLFAACFLLSGCAAPSVPARPYLDELEAVLTLRARISGWYTGALESVLDYTRAPSPDALESARADCVSAMEQIAGAEELRSALTDEQRRAMAELGMDQVDYETPFRMQAYEKAIRLQQLSDLLYCLNGQPVYDELAASLAEEKLAYERYDWQIEAAGVNDLLAEVPEEELRTFQDVVLPVFAALGGEAVVWETDREVLKARSDAVFDRIEALIESLARENGERYLQLLSEERNLRRELEAIGIDPEDADRLAGELGPLSGSGG